MNDPRRNVGTPGFRIDIDIATLREAINRSLDFIEERLGPSVALGHDLYWDISGPDRWSMEVPPVPEPTLSSLVDDYTEGIEVLTDPREEAQSLLWHTLAHLAGALRALGDAETIESSPSQAS